MTGSQIVNAVTYIFLLLQPVCYIAAFALATATHIEHAETVIFGHVLCDSECFQAIAAQSVQIEDAFLGEKILFMFVSCFEATNEGAFQFFVTMVVDFGKIFDGKLMLVEVVS